MFQVKCYLLLTNPVPQFMHPLRWSFILIKLAFEVLSKVFNGIEVRRLGWPGYYLNIIVFKLLVGLLGGVFSIIVLLKVKVILSLLHLQCLKAFHQTIL